MTARLGNTTFGFGHRKSLSPSSSGGIMRCSRSLWISGFGFVLIRGN